MLRSLVWIGALGLMISITMVMRGIGLVKIFVILAGLLRI